MIVLGFFVERKKVALEGIMYLIYFNIEIVLGKEGSLLKGEIDTAEKNDLADSNQEKINELNGKISDTEKKIYEDMALIEKENVMSAGNYSPVISGARKRISRNNILLFRYKKELKRLM